MHFSSIAKVASLTHTHSHEAGENAPPPSDSKVPHKIVTITTVEEFDQVLKDHHHRRVVVFCVTTDYEDPGVGSYALNLAASVNLLPFYIKKDGTIITGS